jgi:hypothetical protein
MKKITLLGVSLFSMITLFGQAILPTNWDSSGTPPTGWSISGTTTYTGSGNPLPALRFDNQDDYIEIAFAESPGVVSYDITGNPAQGATWAGLFSVLESSDGTNYTTLGAITSLATATYVPMSNTPLATTRYIRFYFTTKDAGNVGLDNVTIALPVAGDNQEIDVMSGLDRIPSSGTAYVQANVGATNTLTLAIKNEGLVNDLVVSNAVISGPDASNFTITNTPTTIAAVSQANLTIDFSPLATGTHNAVLTITSDDADESTYIVNLYGVGGDFATEPSAQPTNLDFTNVKSYRYTVSLTPESTNSYIVLSKIGSAITDMPVDGVQYMVGDYIGTSKVVYKGSSTSFIPNYITAGRTDYFAVFSYSGTSNFVNYLTTSPLIGSVTTMGTMMSPTAYNSINSNNATFVTDLQTLVSPHTKILYGDYSRTIIEGFYEQDTTNGQKFVSCVYTNFKHIYTPPMDFAVISREHTIPQSWMLTVNESTFDDSKEYQDYHNLFPVHQDNANAVRSNHPLGEVVTVTSEFLEGKYGTDSRGITVYEPTDNHKGDAARAKMYMMLTYNGELGNWGLDNLNPEANDQDQDVLRAWHFQDPPSSKEIARNDYIDSLQGNRNPFIDSVNYACYINFYDMTKINLASPCVDGPESSASLNELNLNSSFSVFPNPSNDKIKLEVKNTEILAFSVTDLLGRKVIEKSDVNNKIAILNVENLKAGTYIVLVNTPKGSAKSTFVVNK